MKPGVTQRVFPLAWMLSRHGTLICAMLGGAAELAKRSRWFNCPTLALRLPSPPHHITTVPAPQPFHTPRFLNTPSPNCSHYERLMSGAACASRCPRGARKRAWTSVFFSSPTRRWPVIRLACQICCQYHSSHLSQPSMLRHLLVRQPGCGNQVTRAVIGLR